MEQKIKVIGMMCVNCERRVCNVLSQVEGINQVVANSKEQYVQVNFDNNIISLEAICEKINDIGYEVK